MNLLRHPGLWLLLFGLMILAYIGRDRDEPPETPTPLTMRADAPAWCIEPDYPKGDTWYERCVEPRP
jgi:hypothetical protein